MSSHEAIQRSLRSKFKLILSESKILIQTINGYVKHAERVFEATDSASDLTPKQFTRAMAKLETAYSACVKLILMANELFEHEEKSETTSPKSNDASSSTESETTSPVPIAGSRPAMAKETETRIKALEQGFHEYVAVRERMEAFGGGSPGSGRVKEFRPSMKPALVVNRQEVDGNLDQVIELQRFLHGLDKEKLPSERESGYVNEIACPVAPKQRLQNSRLQVREDLIKALKTMETSVRNLGQGHPERDTFLASLSQIRQLLEGDVISKAKCETTKDVSSSSPANYFIGIISPPPGTTKGVEGDFRKGSPVSESEEKQEKSEVAKSQYGSLCKKQGGEEASSKENTPEDRCHRHNTQQCQQHQNHFHPYHLHHRDQKQFNKHHHRSQCISQIDENQYLCQCPESCSKTSCVQHKLQGYRAQQHLRREMCSPHSDHQQAFRTFPHYCQHHEQHHAPLTSKHENPAQQQQHLLQVGKDADQSLDQQMALNQILQLVTAHLMPNIQSHTSNALIPHPPHTAVATPLSTTYLSNNPNGGLDTCPAGLSPPYHRGDHQSNVHCGLGLDSQEIHSGPGTFFNSVHQVIKQPQSQQGERHNQQVNQGFNQPQQASLTPYSQPQQASLTPYSQLFHYDNFTVMQPQANGRNPQEIQICTPTQKTLVPQYPVMGTEANDAQSKCENGSKFILGSAAVEVRDYHRTQQLGPQESHTLQQQQQHKQTPQQHHPCPPCNHIHLSKKHHQPNVQELSPNPIDLRSVSTHPKAKGRDLGAEKHEDERSGSDADSDCSPRVDQKRFQEDYSKCAGPYQNEARQCLSTNTAKQVVPPTQRPAAPQTMVLPEGQTPAQERTPTAPAQRPPNSTNSNCCVEAQVSLSYGHQGKQISSKGNKPIPCHCVDLAPYKQSQDEDNQCQDQEGSHNSQDQRKPKAVQDEETVNGEGIRTICITNLPTDLEEIRILELFRQYGRVSKIYFIKHRNTGVFQGIAYVKFSSQNEAESAALALNKTEFDGQVISVHLHHTKV